MKWSYLHQSPAQEHSFGWFTSLDGMEMPGVQLVKGLRDSDSAAQVTSEDLTLPCYNCITLSSNCNPIETA